MKSTHATLVLVVCVLEEFVTKMVALLAWEGLLLAGVCLLLGWIDLATLVDGFDRWIGICSEDLLT